MTDSPIDRLMDRVSDLNATLRQSLQALKLVRLMHDSPEFTPDSHVSLDPKAYEQVKHAIMNAEDILS
jgi:hypothetical protein